MRQLYRDGFDGTPHYTMRRRFPPAEPFNGPGPGAYKPEKGFPSSTHPTAPVYSMRERTKLRPLDKTPGRWSVWMVIMIITRTPLPYERQDRAAITGQDAG